MPWKVLIFIPCYNCEKQLPRVLDALPQELKNYDFQILVVDNQSQDNTAERALKAIQNNPFREKILFYRNESNYNLGGSFKNAFLYAQKMGFSHFAVLHGDDQVPSGNLIPLIKKAKAEPTAGAIFGSRFTDSQRLTNYSFMRKFINLSFNLVLSLLSWTKITDIGSGLNIYNVNQFPQDFISRLPDHAAFDIHILLYALESKMKFFFEPIAWRSQDEVSSINDYYIGWVLIKEIFRWRFLRLSQKALPFPSVGARPWVREYAP